MNELIPVTPREIGDATVLAADGRELHAFLDVGKVFAAWIQERIEQYGFTEGQDFVVFSDSGNNPLGGRPSKEYHITLDMAKELAMVERNAKGKEARQYFIECERRLLAGEPAALPQPEKVKPADTTGLPEFRRARALDMAAKTAERIVAQFPGLSEDSRRVVFANIINPVVGIEILALPAIEKKRKTAGEVGELLGISANMVGRIANLHGLKTDEYGGYQLDKSRHSSKQVQAFVYNDAGVEAIRRHLDAGAEPGERSAEFSADLPAAAVKTHAPEPAPAPQGALL